LKIWTCDLSLLFVAQIASLLLGVLDYYYCCTCNTNEIVLDDNTNGTYHRSNAEEVKKLLFKALATLSAVGTLVVAPAHYELNVGCLLVLLLMFLLPFATRTSSHFAFFNKDNTIITSYLNSYYIPPCFFVIK
jgi:hypothetical protein